MSTALAWRAGSATDTGRQRSANEDRVFVDPDRGIFLVVDGLGGHAAGAVAAETAVAAIAQELDVTAQNPERAVRQAITEANNRIFSLSQSRPELRGMACVLTLVVLGEDNFTVGHVGDSRLYLFWNGKLRKLTCDHSPVGEQEDDGKLDERSAMSHPRRNEIFRDVGSARRSPEDPGFVETKTLPFHADAALLLCSDGLSDAVTSVEIGSILNRYHGDPDEIAGQLVDAANAHGGADNISVVLITGENFRGQEAQELAAVHARNAITRVRTEPSRFSGVKAAALIALGILIGFLAAAAMGNRAGIEQWVAQRFARPAAPLSVQR